MDFWTEVLNRVGGLAVFTIAFIGFALWVTQIAPRRAARRAAADKRTMND